MQNTAVQMTRSRALKESSSASESSSVTKKRNTVSTENADPFMQIIMSMISQSQDSSGIQTQDASGTVTGMGPLLSMLQNSQNSQQNILGLLADSQGLQTNSVLQQYLGDQKLSADQMLQLSQLLTEHPEIAQTDSSGSSVLTQLINLSKSQGTDGLANLINPADQTELTGKNASLSGYTDTSDMISAEKSFAEAISKVKEMLSTTGTNVDDGGDDIDVDKLQSEISNSKVLTPFELSLKTTSKSSETTSLDQIADGIKQNLSLGKNEFTIKLNPDSLGEITVKLVEEAGKSTLTITTASAQTAKLINNDLAALKDAVAPLHVQVNNAVTQASESQQGGMQQNNLAGQQFAGQQFAGQQNFTRFVNESYGNTDTENYDNTTVELQSISARVTNDRLDSYI